MMDRKQAASPKEAGMGFGERLSYDIATYFAKDHGLSLSLVHETYESTKRLCDALDSYSSNQYFSQATARKWFELANRAHIMDFQAEEAGTRLAMLVSRVEVAVLKSTEPELDRKDVEEIKAKIAEIAGGVARCNAQAQELLSMQKEESEGR